MTEKQKTEIIRMRESGASFSKISEITGISRNTIKSFCRRENIEIQDSVCYGTEDTNELKCKQCGKKLRIVPGRKTPKFCCKDCRTQWWNSHPEQVNRKAIYNFICDRCGKAFTAYGNSNRKYCSHSCYINARFKGGGYDDK